MGFAQILNMSRNVKRELKQFCVRVLKFTFHVHPQVGNTLTA
jgi:hypothetical protein